MIAARNGAIGPCLNSEMVGLARRLTIKAVVEL
jgi:hypothetical protein